MATLSNVRCWKIWVRDYFEMNRIDFCLSSQLTLRLFIATQCNVPPVVAPLCAHRPWLSTVECCKSAIWFAALSFPSPARRWCLFLGILRGFVHWKCHIAFNEMAFSRLLSLALFILRHASEIPHRFTEQLGISMIDVSREPTYRIYNDAFIEDSFSLVSFPRPFFPQRCGDRIRDATYIFE